MKNEQSSHQYELTKRNRAEYVDLLNVEYIVAMFLKRTFGRDTPQFICEEKPWLFVVSHKVVYIIPLY